MKDEKKEPLRYLIVLFVYLAAICFAVLLFYFLPLPLWLGLLLADLTATVVVFLFSLLFSNASVYDPYWSVQPIVIVAALCILKREFTAVTILPVIAVALWGIRLTANWALGFKGLNSKYEDWRYQQLRESTGKYYFFVNFFGIHLIPTLIVYGCTVPIILTFEYMPAFNAGCAVFFGISIFAFLLETVADHSLRKFKKEGGTGFLRKGLWKYSRHPNYLGEILFWWGIALSAVCLMPSYWWQIAGAYFNTMLFLFVSIPMADKHASRKEGYALYEKNTRALLPVYKRQAEETDGVPAGE